MIAVQYQWFAGDYRVTTTGNVTTVVIRAAIHLAAVFREQGDYSRRAFPGGCSHPVVRAVVRGRSHYFSLTYMRIDGRLVSPGWRGAFRGTLLKPIRRKHPATFSEWVSIRSIGTPSAWRAAPIEVD